MAQTAPSGTCSAAVDFARGRCKAYVADRCESDYSLARDLKLYGYGEQIIDDLNGCRSPFDVKIAIIDHQGNSKLLAAM